MKFKRNYLCLFVVLLASHSLVFAQQKKMFEEHFNDQEIEAEKIGRGLCEIKDGVLRSKNAYLAFGKNEWDNYEASFKARIPITEDQVQIWAGVRMSNRKDRYIIGLRGGTQNDLYVARLGYMGTDDHLALRHLDFKLEKAKWYKIRVQVYQSHIRIYLNDESLPRVNVTDPHSDLSPNGKVTLGGSWITTEFDDLTVKNLTAKDWNGESAEEYRVEEDRLADAKKEKVRKKQRESYHPLKIEKIGTSRTVVSLNGNWLFAPGYQVTDRQAIDSSISDQNWHILKVPDFWNPDREWLHGERYNTASKGVSDNYYQKEIERCKAYTFDYKKTSVGYYRQWLWLPKDSKGKHLELNFDAVSKVGEVFINGKSAAQHVGMFGAFQVDASDRLKPGRNLIVVKVTRDYVKNIKDADKVTDVAVTVPVTNKMLKDLAHGFYDDDPAGIWQPVSLIVTDPVRIGEIFIKPGLHGAVVDLTIKNYTKKAGKFDLTIHIGDANSKSVIYNQLSKRSIYLQGMQERKITCKIDSINPKLWTPETPNLYNFSFLLTKGKKELDRKEIISGFRTFGVKGDYFYLNGRKYWLRGGDHTPMSLAPNDTLLANKFTRLMHEGNLMITRTHTAPYDEVWMTASDKNGVGVSYEGQWPWLMISSSMPDQKLIDLWKNEYFDLIRKYRNHPSLLFYTINNEMKFYDNDPDFQRTKLKMKIISDVVKEVRKLDPTRPVCFDSNYRRNEKKFGKTFFDDIDDGDIDDQHWYINWYHGSIFSEFKGEWQQKFKNPGRPLISQELSTGYPSETGHPARFYTYVHQNPSSLVGDYAYEYANPSYFLQAQSFITREVAEAIRRTNEKAAGILHFAALTWFKNVYSADSIQPHRTYYQLKKALQPVLVSAELWGRHFFSGTTLPTRIYVVNDSDDGRTLDKLELEWELQTSAGKVLEKGRESFPDIPYYGRRYITPVIRIPSELPDPRTEARLVLKLLANGKVISGNDYQILLADHSWLNIPDQKGKKVILFNVAPQITTVLNGANIEYQKSDNLENAMDSRPDVLLIGAEDSSKLNSPTIVNNIRKFVSEGGKVLMLNGGDFAARLYPKYITGILQEDGEILSMEIPESSVFNGIEPLDIRYFNNNKREHPLVCKFEYQVNRNEKLTSLAAFTKVHGYLNGKMNERKAQLEKWRGFPIVKIASGSGKVILSEVLLEKGETDPIAARLLVNMVGDLMNKQTKR